MKHPHLRPAERSVTVFRQMRILGTLVILFAALPALAQERPAATPARPIPEAVPLNPIKTASVAKPTVTTPAAAAHPAAPKPVVATPPTDLNIAPSWETQKLARTYVFTIPAPRGQIVDRNGVPLAQSRIAHNLAIQFPTPLQFSDAEASRFICDQVAIARGILRRDVSVDMDKALKH